jgi:hypothetical protein
MMLLPASQTARVVVDVQQALDELEASGRSRNNRCAIDRIRDILCAFRRKAGHSYPTRIARPSLAVEAREETGEPPFNRARRGRPNVVPVNLPASRWRPTIVWPIDEPTRPQGIIAPRSRRRNLAPASAG